MTGVTNELMHELLKRMDVDISETKFDVQDLRRRMTGAEESLVGVHRRLDHTDERIERRLELRELAEAQPAYKHQ